MAKGVARSGAHFKDIRIYQTAAENNVTNHRKHGINVWAGWHKPSFSNIWYILLTNCDPGRKLFHRVLRNGKMPACSHPVTAAYIITEYICAKIAKRQMKEGDVAGPAVLQDPHAYIAGAF